MANPATQPSGNGVLRVSLSLPARPNSRHARVALSIFLAAPNDLLAVSQVVFAGLRTKFFGILGAVLRLVFPAISSPLFSLLLRRRQPPLASTLTHRSQPRLSLLWRFAVASLLRRLVFAGSHCQILIARHIAVCLAPLREPLLLRQPVSCHRTSSHTPCGVLPARPLANR